MATPFFRGNYGSALSRVDTRPIMEAGRARGQMFANMGAQVGGMIKEYGLNKEKQKENKNTIKSSIGILKRLQQIDPENSIQYETQIEQLNNEDIGLRERAGLADKTLQGISITGQMQSNILRNQSAANLLQTQKDTQSAVKSAASDSLALIDEVESIQKSVPNFKPSPVIQDLLAKKDQLKVASASGNPASLPKPFDPMEDEAARLRLGAARRGEDVFEGMGGVEGAVERSKEDRALTRLSALGLYNARMNMGSGGSSGTKTKTLQENLEDAQKELSRRSSLETTFKDSDGKTMSIIHLVEVKPTGEFGLIEGYDLSEMSPVDRNNYQLFVSQSKKVHNAQRQMPVELNRIFDLTEFGDEPLEVGQEIEFGEGKRGRIVSIENGKVNVIYEGTLYEKNLLDMEAKQRAEAARLEEQRKSIPQIRSDFERAGGGVKFGQPKF